LPRGVDSIAQGILFIGRSCDLRPREPLWFDGGKLHPSVDRSRVDSAQPPLDVDDPPAKR
jgi:hypothetical protein